MGVLEFKRREVEGKALCRARSRFPTGAARGRGRASVLIRFTVASAASYDETTWARISSAGAALWLERSFVGGGSGLLTRVLVAGHLR